MDLCDALEALKAKGLAVTEQRLAILQKIFDTDCHFTAKELHRALPAEKRVDLATVYRTVRLFEREGLVRCVGEIENCRYYAKACAHNPPHAHFRCEKCGHLFCLRPFNFDDSKELASLVGKGFEVRRATLVFEGLCAKCRKGKLIDYEKGGEQR
ncbi:Fur family transcriptional regulator [Acetomicrobium sp. S15 = DSM 107314]|uniref:Fur family transcriptional regulator n=1 Tax=Acetomicrobium sp. S15 = DSM 107314 TaxID=2529858 RepID=UPI0018E184CD|nr:Fur family transcriptional regulator [Acetomicrobium sp. S15 = DSM 107314]